MVKKGAPACSTCHGNRVITSRCSGCSGVGCSNCNYSGHVRKTCPTCNGTGRQ